MGLGIDQLFLELGMAGDRGGGGEKNGQSPPAQVGGGADSLCFLPSTSQGTSLMPGLQEELWEMF